VAGGDLQDHVFELVGFQQLDGHAALARAHAHGHAAVFIKIGCGKGNGFPRAGGERADAHVAEDGGVNPVHRRGALGQHKAVAVNAQGQFLGKHDAAKGRADIKGVTLGIQCGVGHLADATHKDGIERARRVQVGAPAPFDGAVVTRQHRKPCILVAHGFDGRVGADFFAHAATHAGVGNAGLLHDDRARGMLLRRVGKGLARKRDAAAHHAHFNGVESTGRHARAAHGAQIGAVFYLPAQVVNTYVLSSY